MNSDNACMDPQTEDLIEAHKEELAIKKVVFKWRLFAPGLPYCIDSGDVDEIPLNEHYSELKSNSFQITKIMAELEVGIKSFTRSTDSWKELDHIKMVFCFNRTKTSNVVSLIWNEDSFFGYQYLNGVNPMLIKKCTKLPENFPVSSSMVASSLGTSTDLDKELQEGNIFLADYKILQGITANFSINGRPQYIAAPMCLLWKDPLDQLLPIAIQLLCPHVRYTLDINSLARSDLVGPGGVFDQVMAVGKGGINVLMEKAMQEVTYSGLCLPDDIEARGLESIPNYYYRDDGRMIWEAMESFVSKIVQFYYKGDESVRTDPELQAWVADIYEKGFLNNKSAGIPSFLKSMSSLVKYLTMVIFRCSAQHAAVNSGQFDFYSWMPNGPSSMKRPPPKAKGVTTLQTILDSLPSINTTITGLVTVRQLSKEPKARRPIGDYKDVLFTETAPQKFIQEFQEKLTEISKVINEQNQTRCLSYLYLDPKKIENSVST